MKNNEDRDGSNEEVSPPIARCHQFTTATHQDDDDASVAEIEMQERVSSL